MSIASTATSATGDAAAFAVAEEVAVEQARVRRATAARRARHRLYVWMIRAISLAIVLSIWQLGGQRIDPVLFTTPSAVAQASVQMIASGELWSYLWPSLVVLGVGLFASCVAGIGVGLLLARFWVLDVGLDMYITFLYSTPSVALVPLIVLWVGFESTAKIVILFLFAFFPLVINTYQGVKNVDARLLEVGRAFRCSERQLWTNIVLPAALPFILTGLRLAVGRGLIGMVFADL
jgi:NitT/TauT family transport system permease protein